LINVKPPYCCADAEADLAVPIEAEMSEDTADDDISSRYVIPLWP